MKKYFLKHYCNIFFAVLVVLIFFSCEKNHNIDKQSKDSISRISKDSIPEKSDYKIIVGSFLGDEKRCYYGENPPSELKLIWKCWLSGAEGHMPFHSGESSMRYGAGWTGQPLLFKEKDDLFLLQGSFDYNLRKINANTGNVVWKYSFDDAIKGTGTLFYNRKSESEEGKLIVLQGSRQSAKSDYNFRGISAVSGDELYRMQVVRTPSVSRDVDGSALIYNDTAYIGLENGIFKVFNPNDDYAAKNKNFYEPEIYNELKLYSSKDLARVGGNIVTESSAAFFNGRVYITAGSGYVFGYNISKREIDWEYFIGADLNGSCVVTEDSCLLVTVEKQSIAGNGGVLKLNVLEDPENATLWYYPVGNLHLLSWDGGVIGSASVNDKYKTKEQKSLTAFSGIDGYLYVVDYKNIDGTAISFNGRTSVPKPELIFKYKIGSSISTPIIFKNKLIAAGYGGIFLFEFDENYDFKLLDKKSGTFEATPIVYGGKVFIASKDGYLYCLGDE